METFCNNDNIIDIVKSIIYKSLDGGWGTISEQYLQGVREAKDSTNYIFDDDLLANERNTIEFMGSLRKVYIDHVIKTVIYKIDANKEYYSKFTGGEDIKSLIYANAFGSTNLTSDYDLTITGPGSHMILQCLISQFNELYRDPHFKNASERTTAELFDSNFYVVPDLVLTKYNREKLENINAKLYLLNTEKKMYIQVPNGTNEYELELQSIREKMNSNESLDTRTIQDKYQTLIGMSSMLDRELYSNNPENTVDILSSSESLLDYTLKMCRSSIEAYYALSTILVIVHGLQSKNIDGMMQSGVVSKENCIIAGLENIIDLVLHQSHSFVDGNMDKNMNLAVKVSKYIQRILLCINLITDNEPSEELKRATELTDMIIYYRGNAGSMSKEDRDLYSIKISEFITMFGLDKKLTFKTIPSLFKLLCKRTEHIDTTLFFEEYAQIGGKRRKKRTKKHKRKQNKHRRISQKKSRS